MRRAPVSRGALCALFLGGLWCSAGALGCGGSVSIGTGGGTTSTGGAGGAGGTPTGGSGGTSMGGSDCAGGTSTGGSITGPCDPLCAAIEGIPSECIAIADNSGKTQLGLRMAQISWEKPAALTNPVVAGLLESNTTMNLPECNLAGDGTLSWLLELDTAAGTLKTGGARPAADPTAGYCFVNEMLGTTLVAPIVLNGGVCGKIDVAVGGDVVIPVFFDIAASGYLLLPFSELRITGAVLSSDQSCIGVYNADKLLVQDSCEPGDVPRFTDAGAIDAYITLEDADAVIIEPLDQSLCVLLTGDPGDGGSPMKCERDPATAVILAMGDWCSATNSAGGCADSLKVASTFAASAVEINGDCP